MGVLALSDGVEGRREISRHYPGIRISSLLQHTPGTPTTRSDVTRMLTFTYSHFGLTFFSVSWQWPGVGTRPADVFNYYLDISSISSISTDESFRHV